MQRSPTVAVTTTAAAGASPARAGRRANTGIPPALYGTMSPAAQALPAAAVMNQHQHQVAAGVPRAARASKAARLRPEDKYAPVETHAEMKLFWKCIDPTTANPAMHLRKTKLSGGAVSWGPRFGNIAATFCTEAQRDGFTNIRPKTAAQIVSFYK